MTLEEIRQKMEELSVSEGYLADCCGVDKRYIRQCVTKGSKPMTKVLEQKIEGVFNTLMVTPKALREKEVINVKAKRHRRTKAEMQKVREKEQCSDIKNLICKFGQDYGCSIHTLEFEKGAYHYLWTLEIKEV